MILVWISGYMLPVVFRRAEDLDAGNGKVHTIAEMEKMLEAIK